MHAFSVMRYTADAVVIYKGVALDDIHRKR